MHYCLLSDVWCCGLAAFFPLIRGQPWRPCQWKGMELGSGRFLQCLKWNQARWFALLLHSLKSMLLWLIPSSWVYTILTLNLNPGMRKMTWKGPCYAVLFTLPSRFHLKHIEQFFPDHCRTKLSVTQVKASLPIPILVVCALVTKFVFISFSSSLESLFFWDFIGLSPRVRRKPIMGWVYS